MLFNIIAGVSVCFYDASVEALSQRGDRSKRFKNLLIKYYSWEGESVSPREGSELLYEQTRNPIAHSLGLDSPFRNHPKGKEVTLTKRPLTVGEIRELEVSLKRPAWLPKTIIVEPEGSSVSILTFYWGVHILLHNLFADQEQMKKAKEFLKRVGT